MTIKVEFTRIKGGMVKAHSPNYPNLYIYGGRKESELVKVLPDLINCYRRREDKKSNKQHCPLSMRLSGVTYRYIER